MQRLTFTNSRGTSIGFESVAPYFCWMVEGTGLPSVIPIQTQTVGQSGYTLHSVLLESREVRVKGYVFGREGMQAFYAARKALNAVCNPLLGLGELSYENDAGIWKISAFVIDSPYEGRVGNSQGISISFECPSPFWKSAERFVARLAYIAGDLSFPIRTPNRFGTLGYQAIIDNDSDVETPVELTMDGGSHNPAIVNQTTGEFIKLARHISEGEKLYINTDPEFLEVSLITTDPSTNKKVNLNAYGYITHDSTLFRLACGVNLLTFNSDDENKAVKLTIAFHKLYVGV